MNQIKILTIRPNSEEEKELIQYVMKESGCKTASQAMLFACKAYRINNERNKQKEEERGEKQEIARLKKIITEMKRRNNELEKNLSNRCKEDMKNKEEQEKKRQKNSRKINRIIQQLQMQIDNY